MLGQEAEQFDRREAARTKVSLVWAMFDAALFRPDPRNRGPFSHCFAQKQSLQLVARHCNFSFDDHDTETRPDHIYDAIERSAASTETQGHVTGDSLTSNIQSERSAGLSIDEIDGVTSQFDWVWASGLTQCYHDPTADSHEQSGLNLDWWEARYL